MGKATVIPSQDDENTFTINFVSGDHYKVRASSARERQVWVDRLRHCISHQSGTEEERPPGSDLSLPLSSRDTFGSVREELEKVYERQELVSRYIES